MINFANPLSEYNFLKKAINKKVLNVLKSNDYILGKEVKNFENNFAKKMSCKFCIGAANGTDALIIAIKSLNISYGDKIIVPSHTATATVSAIVEAGAQPVFVDVQDDYNINLNLIREKDLKSAKAIILVHLYGNPCNIDKAIYLKKKFKLKIIEDCSQAHFAKYKNEYVGSFGDVSCFSFYPTKNLSSLGDAGAIVTNSEKTFKNCIALRQYGWLKEKNKSIMHGSNRRMDEIHASILNIKLKHIETFNRERQKIANFYLKNIKNDKIILPNINKSNKSVFHLFVIRVPAQLRKSIILKLNNKGINPGIHYIRACHQQKPYKKYLKNKLKNTDKFVKEVLSLPVYPFISKSSLIKTVKILNSF